MKEILKTILEFIEKHSKFIKKIIIFLIAYFVIAIVNNPSFTTLFTAMFGEFITTSIQATTATILLSLGGD